MTNIGAIKIVEQKKNPEEYIVCVADSMGTILENHSKQDSIQKLFHLGNHLLMGTGYIKVLFETIEKLRKSTFLSSKDLAETALNISKDMGVTKEKPSRFIVAGPDKEGLQIYNIDIAEKEINPMNSGCFDGSGSVYVSNYIQNIHESGQILKPNDVADGLTLLYEFGKQGAKDRGVNDRLQFGIISQNSVTTLYHPGVFLEDIFFLEYINNILKTNIDFPKNSKKEQEIFEEKIGSFNSILKNMYKSLETDLSEHTCARRAYTAIAEKYANNQATKSDLEKRKKERQKTKQVIIKAGNALITKGISALLEYQADFDKRKAEIEAKARTYLH